jgi:hypothetical protein
MSNGSRLALALATGLLAGIGAWGVATMPVRLTPGGPAWKRVVAGAGVDGVTGPTAVVVVPGVGRRTVVQLVIDVEGGPLDLSIAVDRAAPALVRVNGRTRHVLALPATRVPGVHVVMRAPPGAAPPRIHAVELRGSEAGPWAAVLLTALLAAGMAAALAWTVAPALAVPLAWLGLGLIVLAGAPALVFWSLPSGAALVRLLIPGLALAAGLALGIRSGDRRRFALGAGLLAAAVFGAAVRAYFLPSAGSWDVDYWKGCALRTTSHGVTRAYGDPDSVPRGHFLAQLRGEEPAWELPAFGRTFVIDQPPGIMLLWKASWWALTRGDHGLTQDEALNVAAKLPTVAGDLLAVGVLLWAFGRRTRGFVLAALYWALPVSWLSGAVLGFFDGSYVPLAIASLIAAGRGRAVLAGLLLACAALLKSLALLMAPAVAIALWSARAPLRKAVAAGTAVVVAALVPFVLDGTVQTTVIHIYRIIFQQRLSGGYGNVWWILSHVLTLGERAATEKIPYVRIEALPFPVRPLGTLAFVIVAVFVSRWQRTTPGPYAAALAGAVLVLTYGQVAIGIHENHPHAFVLAMVATALFTRRLQILAGVFFTTYVLNMLALSGLGRFYTGRYAAIEPVIRIAGDVRLGLGFDLTLALAIVNVIAFAALLASLRGELKAAAGIGPTGSATTRTSPAEAYDGPLAVARTRVP